MRGEAFETHMHEDYFYQFGNSRGTAKGNFEWQQNATFTCH